jgi:hypothetical protein
VWLLLAKHLDVKSPFNYHVHSYNSYYTLIFLDIIFLKQHLMGANMSSLFLSGVVKEARNNDLPTFLPGLVSAELSQLFI